MDTNQEFEELQKGLEEAVKTGKPAAPYIEKQIECIQKAHDEFVEQAQKQGFKLTDIRVVEIEIEQFSQMRDLSMMLNRPTDKYDQMIKEARIRVFGEENYKNFFPND